LAIYPLIAIGALILFQFETGWPAAAAFAGAVGLALAINFRWLRNTPQGIQPAEKLRSRQTFSSPGSWRIFVGAGSIVSGALLWSGGFVHVFAGLLLGAGWVLMIWGVLLTRRDC
jgi:hypothetical protein